MKRYEMNKQKEGSITYFFIRDTETWDIVLLPTKYLMHMTKAKCSPNTVRRSGCSILYYLEYIEEKEKKLTDVYEMSFTEQTKYFVEFLYWLKAGKHTSGKMNILPNNGTCNAYLKDVFRFYVFIEEEFSQFGGLKVLSYSQFTAVDSVGLKKTIRSRSFKGYLKEEEHKARTAKKDEIIEILKACTNIRDRLLILLLAETGYRIGEILGINYMNDIDYSNQVIRVYFREDNENGARAKNAEYRSAKISADTFQEGMWNIFQMRRIAYCPMCRKERRMNERVEYSQLDCYKRATDEQKRKLNQEQYFDLGKLPEETLRKEFENYIRYRGTKVSILTIKTERNYFNSLCEFLQKPSNQVKSLMERDENVWIKQLKAWMLQKGRALTKAKKRVYQNESVEKVALIRYFENIIQFTVDLSETNELTKDIWYLERLPIIIRSNPIVNHKTINFRKIEQPDIREEMKKAIYYHLQYEAIATVTREVSVMNKFSKYLKEKYPQVDSCEEIDRNIIEKFLIYLKIEVESGNGKRDDLIKLRDVLETVGKIYGWERIADTL